MSTCYSCHTPISNRYTDKICKDCRFNPSITISATEAKRKYKLTDNQIDAADLFTIEFSSRFYSGTKYLIEEIEKLAKTQTDDLPANDKRRLAYMKQKGIRDEIQKGIDKKNEYINNIKVTLHDILIKLDPTIDVSKDFDIPTLIENYATDITVSPNDMAILISGKVSKLVQDRNIKREKQKEIDERIASEWELEKYITLAKTHANYSKYVNSDDQDLDEYMDRIIDIIDCEKRREIIDERITARFKIKKHIKMAMDHPNYIKYVTRKDKGINRCFNGIRRDVLAMLEKEKRIKKINKLIISHNIKNFPNHQAEAHNKFIEGVITLKELMNIIDAYIKDIKEKNDRCIKIHAELEKRDLVEFMIVNGDIYDQYLNAKITLDNIVEAIVNNINHQTRKIVLTNFIEHCYPSYEIHRFIERMDIYQQYIDGTDAITLTNIKNKIHEQVTMRYGMDKLKLKWIASHKREIIRRHSHLSNNICNRLDMELFRFCEDTNQQTITLYNYEGNQRQYLHDCCQVFGLFHQAGGYIPSKTVIIQKPPKWNMYSIEFK